MASGGALTGGSNVVPTSTGFSTTGSFVSHLRRTRRALMPSQTSAPLSLEVVPGPAQQASIWNATVQQARDRQALDNLAQGHSQWFLDYATQRAKDAQSADDKAYWSSLVDETNRKIGEDDLSAQVKAGSKKLEDVQSYLQDRMKSVGTTSAEYPDLITQLAGVKKAIAARDFNSKLYSAQDDLVRTGDHAAYLGKLQTLGDTRGLDDQTRAALADQIGAVQKAIGTEQVNTRYRDASKTLADYLSGATPRAAAIAHLTDLVGQASDPTEANRYAELATQIDTRDRTIERQAASSAAGASTVAFNDAMTPVRNAYSGADAQFTAAFRHGSADRDAYGTLTQEGQHYIDTLRTALPNAATKAIRDKITTELDSVTTNLAERQKQMVELIKQDVSADAADLNSQADRAAAKGTPAGDDLSAQLRFLAVQALQTALADPVIKSQGPSDASVRSLQSQLRETSEKHQAAIDDQAGVVAGQKGPAPLRSANKAAFNAYGDFMAKQGTNTASAAISRGAPVSYDDFLAAVDQSGGDPRALATLLNIGVDPAAKKADAQKAQVEIDNLLGGWTTNIHQATSQQQDIVNAANDRLKALVAPRDAATGRKVSDSGPIDAPVDATDYLRNNATAPLMYAHRAQDVAPQEVNTYGGLLDNPPAVPDAAPPPPSRNTMSSGLEEDPYAQSESAAFKWLDTPQYAVDLPQFDVAPLPDVPALDSGDGELYSMPPAPLTQRRVPVSSGAQTSGDSSVPVLAA